MVLIIDHSADHAQHHTHQTLALSCDKGAKESLTNFPGCGKRHFLNLTSQVVVGMVLCVISLLTMYMAFLHLLDPWLTRRRQTAYKQHAEEEVGEPSLIVLLRKKLSACSTTCFSNRTGLI